MIEVFSRHSTLLLRERKYVFWCYGKKVIHNKNISWLCWQYVKTKKISEHALTEYDRDKINKCWIFISKQAACLPNSDVKTNPMPWQKSCFQ